MKLKQERKTGMDDIPELTRALPKWEYKVVKIETDLEKHLDELGAMGWELVTIEHREYSQDGIPHKYLWTVFKRPVF